MASPLAGVRVLEVASQVELRILAGDLSNDVDADMFDEAFTKAQAGHNQLSAWRSIQMKVTVVTSPGETTVVDVPTPTVGPSDALVKIRACGICG
jgi:hypothetical protein